MRLLRDLTETVDKRQSFLVGQESGRFLRNKDLQAFQFSLRKLIESYAKNRQRHIDSNELIGTMLERSEEAIFIISSDNHVILSNNAAERFFAQEGESLKGRHINGLTHSTKLLNYLRSVREGHKVSQEAIEVEVRRLEQTYWFQVSAAALSGTSRDQDRIFIVLYNITRLKQLEELRTEFVANVSHELRTPLTVIRGFVDTLNDDAGHVTPEERRGFLKRIQKNVVRLHRLVEDLLLLSRLELEPQSFIKREPFSLKVLIAEVVDQHYSRYGADALSIITDPGVKTLMVPLDPLRISQVFENLLNNAQHYAKGATRIVISIKVEDDYVRCSVEDDGCGIPAASLPHIFERLYRVDRARSRETGGTGLGLSIVKHIVQQHGGVVEPHSIEGVGTRIEFTLPLQDRAQ